MAASASARSIFGLGLAAINLGILLPLMIGGMIVTTNTFDDVERDVGSLTSSDTATDHHHDPSV